MKLTLPSNYISALTLGTLLVAAAGCSVSEQRQEGGKFPVTGATPPPAPSQRQQLKAVRNFAKTSFQLGAVEEAQLAGLDLRPGSGSPLPAAQVNQLKVAASGAGTLPLRLRLRLEARNPNHDKVMLNQLEYLVLVDNREVASGSTDSGLEIDARSTLAIPLTITTDVREALTAGLSPEALANALSSWNRKPAHFSVQVRPTFQNAAGRAFRTTDFEPIEASVAGR